MEMPSKEVIAEWHGVIMAHAKANYNDVWHYYVECYSENGLSILIEDKIQSCTHWKKEWDVTLESVMKELKEMFSLWQERDEEMMAEARSHRVW